MYVECQYDLFDTHDAKEDLLYVGQASLAMVHVFHISCT